MKTEWDHISTVTHKPTVDKSGIPVSAIFVSNRLARHILNNHKWRFVYFYVAGNQRDPFGYRTVLISPTAQTFILIKW